MERLKSCSDLNILVKSNKLKGKNNMKIYYVHFTGIDNPTEKDLSRIKRYEKALNILERIDENTTYIQQIN